MPEFQNYIIYSDNRFYNRKNDIWLNINKRTKDGYLRVTLKSDKGEIRTFLCHRLIWQLFVGEIPKGMQVNHKDENKFNNEIILDEDGKMIGGNLELVTPKENCNYGNRNQKISDKCKGRKVVKQSFMVEIEGQEPVIYNGILEMCRACGEKRTTWNHRIYHAQKMEESKVKILPDGRMMKITIITPEFQNELKNRKEIY